MKEVDENNSRECLLHLDGTKGYHAIHVFAIFDRNRDEMIMRFEGERISYNVKANNGIIRFSFPLERNMISIKKEDIAKNVDIAMTSELAAV